MIDAVDSGGFGVLGLYAARAPVVPEPPASPPVTSSAAEPTGTTQATASAKSSRTRRNFKSEPTVVVATSIVSLHHPGQIPAGTGGQITHRRALTVIFKANPQV